MGLANALPPEAGVGMIEDAGRLPEMIGESPVMKALAPRHREGRALGRDGATSTERPAWARRWWPARSTRARAGGGDPSWPSTRPRSATSCSRARCSATRRAHSPARSRPVRATSRRADGGTLFIDEVADLSARAQAKLLRFLEQREYNPVGESRPRRGGRPRAERDERRPVPPRRGRTLSRGPPLPAARLRGERPAPARPWGGRHPARPALPGAGGSGSRPSRPGARRPPSAPRSSRIPGRATYASSGARWSGSSSTAKDGPRSSATSRRRCATPRFRSELRCGRG